MPCKGDVVKGDHPFAGFCTVDWRLGALPANSTPVVLGVVLKGKVRWSRSFGVKNDGILHF